MRRNSARLSISGLGGDEVMIDPDRRGRSTRGTTMKYVLMYTSRPDLAAGADPEAAQAIYQRVYEWFGENAGVMADSGAELLGVETATTVRHGSEGAVVVDGPFNEAKEVIGGFSVIDVADMDAAIAVVKTWPLLDAARRRRRDPADGRGLLPHGGMTDRRTTSHRTTSSRGPCARRPVRWWPGSPGATATSTWPRRPCRARWSRR